MSGSPENRHQWSEFMEDLAASYRGAGNSLFDASMFRANGQKIVYDTERSVDPALLAKILGKKPRKGKRVLRSIDDEWMS